jgi:protein O-mannosyl-transferase
MTRRARKRPGPLPGTQAPRTQAGSTPDGPRAPASRTSVLLGAAAVFACACAVFWPTLTYKFLNWDDPTYILKNPWINELTWENVRAVFTTPYFLNYLPLHLLSYMFDHAIWGLNPKGYHLSSVLIHGLNSVLCLVVARRLSGSLAIGMVSALFFAVHPSHVEAVVWISSRKEVLSTTFMLLSLLAYIHARRGKALRPVPYAASVIFFLMGMLSKVSVVVLPAFLLLLDWMPERRAARASGPSLIQSLVSKVPYGIVGAVLILVNLQVQVKADNPYVHDPLQYIGVKGHALWNYLGLLGGMTGRPDYDTPGLGSGIAGMLLNLAGLLVLPAAAWLFLRLKRRTEFLGLSWAFIALLPAILFPLMTYMADRYLYAPSLGFCWALAAVVVGLGRLDRFPRLDWKGIAAVAVTVAIALGFTIQTLRYSAVWKNSESLWSYAITKSQDYRVLNNLGAEWIIQKRWAEAEKLLKTATKVENLTSYQSLGVLYNETHRHDEALKATDRALEILSKQKPIPALSAELHFNRGAILWAQGHVPEAVAEWRTALREDPSHAHAKEMLAIAAQRFPKEVGPE